MLEPEPFPDIREDEQVVRHCRHQNDMRTGLGKARFCVFLPPANHRMSVVRSTGLSAEELGVVGRRYVHEDVKGHAEIAYKIARSRGLSLEADPHPHARHANLIGWSTEDEVNRLTAKALAEASVLTVY